MTMEVLANRLEGVDGHTGDVLWEWMEIEYNYEHGNGCQKGK